MSVRRRCATPGCPNPALNGRRSCSECLGWDRPTSVTVPATGAHLTVLCGIPCSGKSTWATARQPDAVMLTADTLRTNRALRTEDVFDGIAAAATRADVAAREAADPDRWYGDLDLYLRLHRHALNARRLRTHRKGEHENRPVTNEGDTPRARRVAARAGFEASGLATATPLPSSCASRCRR